MALDYPPETRRSPRTTSRKLSGEQSAHVTTLAESTSYSSRVAPDRMAVMVEGYVNGRKITYDMVKLNQLLMEALVNRGVLRRQDLLGYAKSRDSHYRKISPQVLGEGSFPHESLKYDIRYAQLRI